jgi:hypothetical protein
MTYENCKGGRSLVFDDFWSKSADVYSLAEEKGCYVFAIRSGRGVTPVYVGKATKSFKQEIFNATNRNKYHDGFKEFAKGTPLIYFVVRPTRRGPTSYKEIEEIENFFIQAGVTKNPKLQNVRGIQQPSWSIKGVIRSGAGKRSEAEVQFISLFDIRE